MNATSSARIERGTPRVRRFVLIAIGVALGIGGCGGGGGSGGNPSGGSVAKGGPAEPPAPAAFGTVNVSVKDMFGAPVDGAGVTLIITRIGDTSPTFSVEKKTDATGTAVFRVVAARVSASAAYDEIVSMSGGTPEVDGPKDTPLDLAITLVATGGNATFGVASASVEPNAVAADGRSLEFSLRLLTPLDADYNWITMDFCIPDTANDAGGFQPDCIKGPAGFDAAYEAANSGEPLSVATTNASAVPFSAALLVDQSRNIVVNDPTDARLFVMKYFLTTKRATDRVVLAAFASDEPASGEFSSLPKQPVSIFPVENPQFTTSSSDLFPTIDALDQLEGGVAPLYASIDRMLDFTVKNASISTRRAVVVLTDGRDDTCGTPAQCQTAQEALITKSRATGVAIVTLGLAVPPPGLANARALSELAELSGGAALWADGPRDLGSLFEGLSGVLDGSATITTARFRIESTTDGAFQSGRTVHGTAHYDRCWDCATRDIPFAVQIP